MGSVKFEQGEVFDFLRRIKPKNLGKALDMAPPVDRLAIAADREGMTPDGIRKFPDLISKYRLDGVDLTDLLCRQARRVDSEQFARLLSRLPVALESLDDLPPPRTPGHAAKQARREVSSSDEGKDGVARRPAGSDTIFGHSATSVIRWLGANGYSAADAHKLSETYNLTIAPATVTTQFQAGVKGKRGGPANLSEAQIAELVEKCKIQKSGKA